MGVRRRWSGLLVMIHLSMPDGDQLKEDRELIKELLGIYDDLGEWETEFIDSVEKRLGSGLALTDKQRDVAIEIARRNS